MTKVKLAPTVGFQNVGMLTCSRSLPYLSKLRLPQQSQTIESISGHTYIRKRISLNFFVKKLILWSEGLFQPFLSDATLFVCKAVTFFNEIDLHPYNSYYLRNTLKLIHRSSSIVDQLLGLIYTPVAASVIMSVATSVCCLYLYRDIYNL